MCVHTPATMHAHRHAHWKMENKILFPIIPSSVNVMVKFLRTVARNMCGKPAHQAPHYQAPHSLSPWQDPWAQPQRQMGIVIQVVPHPLWKDGITKIYSAPHSPERPAASNLQLLKVAGHLPHFISLTRTPSTVLWNFQSKYTCPRPGSEFRVHASGTC